MSYRCAICASISPPALPQRRFVLYRKDAQGRNQIAREIPVCYECDDDLRGGVSLAIMLEEHSKGRPTVAADAHSYVLLKARPLARAVPMEFTRRFQVFNHSVSQPPPQRPEPYALGETAVAANSPSRGGLADPLPAVAPKTRVAAPPAPPKPKAPPPRKAAPKPMEMRKPERPIPRCERCGKPADLSLSLVGLVLCEGCAKSATKGARGRKK